MGAEGRPFKSDHPDQIKSRGYAFLRAPFLVLLCTLVVYFGQFFGQFLARDGNGLIQRPDAETVLI